MKHKPYTCECCGGQTKRARGVEVTNMKNPILCDNCNLILCIRGELEFSETILLKLNKDENHQDGDTTNATAYKNETWYEKRERENKEFWDHRRMVDLQNQMSGFPPDNGVHGSY